MRRLRSAIGDCRGALSVDFVLLLLPLLYIFLAMFEVFTTLMVQHTLDRAVNRAARDVAKGVINGQSGESALATLKASICSNGGFVLVSQSACEVNLLVDLRSVSSGAPIPSAVVDGAINAAAFGYQGGTSADVIMLRAALPLPFLSPISLTWWPHVSGTGDGAQLLVSTAVGRLDPYAAYQVSGAQ